jgi:hypothetical protein
MFALTNNGHFKLLTDTWKLLHYMKQTFHYPCLFIQILKTERCGIIHINYLHKIILT